MTEDSADNIGNNAQFAMFADNCIGINVQNS